MLDCQMLGHAKKFGATRSHRSSWPSSVRAGRALLLAELEMKSSNLRLTIKLRDGRTLSGIYHYLGALARLDAMRDLGNVAEWRLDSVSR